MRNLFKSLIIISFLVGSGCAHLNPEPTYVTSHGFNVFCESESVCFSKAQVEVATELLIDELVEQVPEEFSREDIKEHLDAQYQWHDIKFVDSIFFCSASNTGRCHGLTTAKKIFGFDHITLTVVKKGDCISLSALTHELIHLFHRMILNRKDPSHSWEPYWSYACTEEKYSNPESLRVCRANCVLRSANWKLCQEFCGDLCKDAKED